MTKEFLNALIEKAPDHNQLAVRALANRIVKAYDDLLSKDSYKVRKDANDEFNKLEMKEVETVQEFHARFRNSLWNRNSKHINVRFFFIKQYLDDDVMKISHCPTKEMIADICTKPIQGEQFRVLRDMLLGYA